MINAIKYMDDLVETGFTQEQSKTTVSMWMELMNENLATKVELKALELATTSELKALELATKNEFTLLRTEMNNKFAAVRSEMKDMENRLTIKLGAMLATGIGVIALISKM